MNIEKRREQERELKNPIESRGKHFEIWKQYLIEIKAAPMDEKTMADFLHKQGTKTGMLKNVLHHQWSFNTARLKSNEIHDKYDQPEKLWEA